MKSARFTSKRAGTLLRAERGFWCYVPNPLPPELTLSWQLVKELSVADRAFSELAGTARTLPNPHLLIRPFMFREAVLSSKIEGTQTELSDLLMYKASVKVDNAPADVREVANYVSALEYGLSRILDFPISLRLIREIHGRLMDGVRGQEQTPGEFRTSPNWIGPQGCVLEDATYVPPSPEFLMTTLGDLERYIHTEEDLPPLVRMALIHYQFEAIHPFLDGNGRVGRLLIILLMCHQGLLGEPILYLSAYFERNRSEYNARLLAVSQEGAWEEWLAFFLRGVVEQAQDAVDRSQKLLDMWHDYRQRFQTDRSSALVLQIIDDLFASPILTVPEVTQRYGKTFRAIQIHVDRLVVQGVLTEVTGRTRDRVYVAKDIMRILEQ